MKKKAEYSHESAELNAMLGKNVRITLFSGKVITGTLGFAEWRPGRYACGDYKKGSLYKNVQGVSVAETGKNLGDEK